MSAAVGLPAQQPKPCRHGSQPRIYVAGYLYSLEGDAYYNRTPAQYGFSYDCPTPAECESAQYAEWAEGSDERDN